VSISGNVIFSVPLSCKRRLKSAAPGGLPVVG